MNFRCEMHNYGGHFGRGGMPIGGIFMAILIIVGIVLLVNYLSKRNVNLVTTFTPNQNVLAQQNMPQTAVQNSAALAILDERYAKGEIEQQDYLRMKQDLQK